MAAPRDIEVAVLDRSRRAPLGSTEVVRLLRQAARFVGAPHGEVAVLFTHDEEIRKLNLRFRRRNRATDVLAFPDGRGPAAEVRRIGDIVISVPAARRNAREAGEALAGEIRRLLLHGFLHLLGYDHEVDEGEMEKLERDLAARILPKRRARARG
jgi:rRNA maturation RNase YbeY